MDAVMSVPPTRRSANLLGATHRLLDWWGQGLRLAVPASLRQRWFPVPPCVWLRLENDRVRAWVGRRDAQFAGADDGAVDAEAVLARHPDMPRWLLLPGGNAARAVVSLPLAAADHLREALGYEIDRQTPFAAADVAWDARLMESDADAKIAVAELVVVPLARFALLISNAQQHGIVLQGVDVADAEGQPLGINLLPEKQRLRPVNRWRQRNLVLAAIAVLLMVFAAAGSVYRERQRIHDIKAEMQAQRSEVRQVTEQRQRLADLTEGARRIQTERGRRAPASVLLNALAEHLPGDSYLERLNVQGDQMQLAGVSPQSTRLVPALQGSPLWRDVGMGGAVSADLGRAGDRYTLTMRLQPLQPAADK